MKRFLLIVASLLVILLASTVTKTDFNDGSWLMTIGPEPNVCAVISPSADGDEDWRVWCQIGNNAD